MKLFRKTSLFFLSLIFAVAILGCDKKSSTTTVTPTAPTTTPTELSELDSRLHSIYQLGFSTGAITESYEDWLVSIRGEDGEDGREVLLRVSGGYIQWQYSGDSAWQNLIPVSNLTGPAGPAGTNGTNGQDGEDGRDVSFRISDGYLQWQFVGDSVWTNLLSLAEIAGTDGITPTISISNDGFWVINGTKTEFRAVPIDVVAPSVDLTFDLNGGTFEPGVEALYLDLPKGDTVTLPIPEKHGYVFAGWFTGDTVNDGQFLNTSVAAKDLTLYARWTADTRGIQLLLSQLISGTNFVLEYSQTEKTGDNPDYVENWRLSSSVDETGRIHRLITGNEVSGTEILRTESRSSIVVGEYEYYFLSADEGEEVYVGKRYADLFSRRKISWNVPNVDCIFEYFRIEDFRLRADEFVLDYVSSDDGLIAYCHNIVGSDADDDNLKAVFYGDTGIFEITIPVWDDTYESYDCTVIQTFNLVSIGASTNRFLFDEYKTEILSSLEERADSRIDGVQPTDATQTPFLVLLNELTGNLSPIADPVLLWDAYTDAIYQLESYPLVQDPQKVAAKAAKAQLDGKLAELSSTATDASILAMEALLPELNAQIVPASEEVLAGILADCFQELEAAYVEDPAKAEYQEAKELVYGYLMETSNFFLYVLSGPDSWMTFQIRLAEAEAAIEAASTAEAVYAVWDGFGTSLKTTSGLVIDIGFQNELSARYEGLRMTYLERTECLFERSAFLSKEFDLGVLSVLTPLQSVSVFDFMHEYLAAEEKMDSDYLGFCLTYVLEQKAALDESVANFATPGEQLLYLSTVTPLFEALMALETGGEVLSAWDNLLLVVQKLPVSELTVDKVTAEEDLKNQMALLSVTANAESLAAMEQIVADFKAYLTLTAATSQEVNDGYYSASEALDSAFFPEVDTILMAELREENLTLFRQLGFLYNIATNYSDLGFQNDVNQAIHETLIATEYSVLSAIGGDLLFRISTDPTFISNDVANEMIAILEESLSQWDSHYLQTPSLLEEEFDEFGLFLTSGPAFGSAFGRFSNLFLNMESSFWGAYSDTQKNTVYLWHEEKSAIVYTDYLADVDYLYDRVTIFLGLSRDEALWNLIMQNYQAFLIDCPSDPDRLNRWEVSQDLREEIDAYAPIVTSTSLSVMIALHEEFVGLLEDETDRDAMDMLLAEYQNKLFEAYVEDPDKAAFLNLKDYYGVLFSAFGDVFYTTLYPSTPELWDLDDRYYKASLALESLTYSLQSPELALNQTFGELVGLYLICGGTTFDLVNLDYLSEQIEYVFYYYATGGTYYLEDQVTAMDNLRYAAQANLVASSNLLQALTVYADYVSQMKILARNAHRDTLLAMMLSDHDDLFYRILPADRTAFSDGYLVFKTRLQNALCESSLETIYSQFQTLVGNQVTDPLLNAKCEAIAYIQQWLRVQWYIATDDSRTAMGAAQTSAYDVIYDATTVEEVNAALDAGKLALDEAFVEDPVRLSLYGEEMSLAAIELSQLLTDITNYADDIRGLNQAVVIVTNARLAVWTASDSIQLAGIVSGAKSDIAALSINWDPAKLEECRTQYLGFMSLVLNSFGGTVPAAVQTAYDEGISLIGVSLDALMIIDVYNTFFDIAEANR